MTQHQITSSTLIAKSTQQPAQALEDCLTFMRIHPVFHVSLLQPYREDGRVQPPPLPFYVGKQLAYTADRILDHKAVRRGRRKNMK